LEDGMAGAPQDQPRKLSRQQMRAQSREKRDAAGWIAAIKTDDPWMRGAIRGAIGNRHVTRAELEEALGMSLEVGAPPPAPAVPAPREEPERITLQHILISFAGAGTRATRTREEAEELAAETLARAQRGEEFGELVKALTDDSFPGIYRLCNNGITPQANDEYRRGGMVPAFGDVGFALEAGDIGMSTFDPRSSPYGWHIIKRLA
jgi:parvulin-like peptidyl-prolyl isomerase